MGEASLNLWTGEIFLTKCSLDYHYDVPYSYSTQHTTTDKLFQFSALNLDS